MQRRFKNWLKSSTRIGLAGLCASALLATSTPVVKADLFDSFDTAIDTIATGFDFIWPEYLELKDFNVRLGFGLGSMPDYLGSNNYRFLVVPLIDVRYKNLIAMQGTKIRYNFLRHKNFRAGPLVNLLFGRNESRNDILTGLGSISDTFQVGAFVEGNFPSGFIFSADIRKALGAGQGTTVRLVLAQGIYKSDKMMLAVVGWFDWGSGRHNQTNFGISASQAANSTLQGYAAGAGLNNFGINLVARQTLSDRWRVESIVGYGRILGDASDSPLVAGAGSSHQGLAGVGLRYSF